MLAGLIYATLLPFVFWIPFYRNPLYQDESLHWYIGRKWLSGKIPYRDYHISLGPHAALTCGIGARISGEKEWLFHILSVAWLSAGSCFLFLTAHEFLGRTAGFVASALYAFYMLCPYYIGDRFPPESYMSPPCILAAYFLLKGMVTPHVVFALACGLCLSWATLVRQTAMVYVPVFGSAFWVAASGAHAFLFGIGFGLPHLFWMFYFYRKDALEQYVDVFFKSAFHVGFTRAILQAKQCKRNKVPFKNVYGLGLKEFGKLFFRNSMIIMPVYFAAGGYAVYASRFDSPAGTVYVLVLLLFVSLLLVNMRFTYDSCYWLNTVPWASALAGGGIGRWVEKGVGGGRIESYLLISFILCFFCLLGFMYRRAYLTFDPEKRDRLFDEKKVGHWIWWPTFNQIGDYIGSTTEKDAQVLVLGHAARIYNRSQRDAFFYEPSFVPNRHREQHDEIYQRFTEKLKASFPEVIVLAGHMPAFPFNPKPYLEDIEEIQRQSGIVYIAKKVIDGFPIYFADVEKSYIRALVKGRFLNERLKNERNKMFEETLKLEKEIKENRFEPALLRFVGKLKENGRYEDLIHTVIEICNEKRFCFSKGEYEFMLLALGEAQFQLGHAKEAQKTFEKVISLNPESSEALNNLGVVYASKGEYEKAHETFAAVLSRNPHNVDAQQNVKVLVEQLESVLPSMG